jgi:hypothetical protein
MSAVTVDNTTFTLHAIEAADRVAIRSRRPTIEGDWQTWLSAMFPNYVDRSFSAYHAEYWDWIWSLGGDQRARPFVAIWPRGAGKSTSTEMACASVAARQTRRYALYICETQEQADDHVANVAGLLESPAFAATYPDASSRRVGKYGNVRGWRRNRLRTASGFTLDAIGLDTAARGVKLDEDRPDLLIFDDIDGKLDSIAASEKKITTITHTLIPAGSDDSAVLAVQNLVIPDGVFSRLADGRADFLSDRIVSGPHPAIVNLTYETRDGKTLITGGTATWPEGMSIAVCQQDLDLMGITAFKAEKQHDVEAPAGGMFDHLIFRHCSWDDMPALVRTAVWVDPAVTNTDQSDSHGIQADGISSDDTVYRLYSWEARTTPQDVLQRAIIKAIELGAQEVGVETDQGGDTWRSVYNEAVNALIAQGKTTKFTAPKFTYAKAGAGHGPKAQRASQMLTAYERGKIVHVVGTHELLEKALRRFPKSKPFDLVDAAYWSWWSLAGKRKPGKIVGI